MITFLHVQDTSVAKVFTRVRSWFMETGMNGQSSAEGTSEGLSAQWACVRVMHAIARSCPDLLFAHAGLTLPLIFINTQVSLFIGLIFLIH